MNHIISLQLQMSAQSGRMVFQCAPTVQQEQGVKVQNQKDIPLRHVA